MTKERSRFRTLLIAGTVSILSVGAIGAISAVQAQGMFGGAHQSESGRPGFGGQMAERMFDRALGSVEATDDQREEIRVIIEAAREDIRALTADTEVYRDQFKGLLAAEELDRAEFALLRQTMLETGDAVSARAMEALLDAAELLSPEQRTALLERGPGYGPRFGSRSGPRFGHHSGPRGN